MSMGSAIVSKPIVESKTPSLFVRAETNESSLVIFNQELLSRRDPLSSASIGLGHFTASLTPPPSGTAPLTAVEEGTSPAAANSAPRIIAAASLVSSSSSDARKSPCAERVRLRSGSVRDSWDRAAAPPVSSSSSDTRKVRCLESVRTRPASPRPRGEVGRPPSSSSLESTTAPPGGAACLIPEVGVRLPTARTVRPIDWPLGDDKRRPVISTGMASIPSGVSTGSTVIAVSNEVGDGALFPAVARRLGTARSAVVAFRSFFIL
mmetsp:Transcript_590/g.1232  ORF Transcript_590/g.1232 Transcript_590/m.1232 type:complete len:264 (+) Transcript_590:1111-1902(+)